MIAVWMAAALAFVVTLVLVPLIIRVCMRWQLLDRPGPLKIHKQPVPRLGGVAITLAICLSSFLAAPRPATRFWPFFIALALVWVASLIDDIRGLSAFVRLAAQIGAGLILWSAGWRAPWPNPAIAATLSGLVTCVIVVAFVNSMNFQDGANGVAAGVSAVIAAAYTLTFLTLRQPFSALIAGSITCSCSGFLRYNWPVAKTFMGDSGSAALGFTLAFLSLSFWQSPSLTPAHEILPLVVAALPLVDATLAILRRLRRGHSPLEGDRGHIYDLMLASGAPPKAVAPICWGITAVFVAIGCYGMSSSSSALWILAGAALFTLIAAELRMGSLRQGDVVPRIPGTSEG